MSHSLRGDFQRPYLSEAAVSGAAGSTLGTVGAGLLPALLTPPGLNDLAVRVVALLANPLVNAVYPLELLTHWHAAHHIAGLTGRWMDTGNLFSGVVRGPYHRLLHGHHLVEDGL